MMNAKFILGILLSVQLGAPRVSGAPCYHLCMPNGNSASVFRYMKPKYLECNAALVLAERNILLGTHH